MAHRDSRHVVLGGSGFIGRHVALALLRRGTPVLIAGRTSPPLPDAERAGLSFVPLDFAEADWDAVLRDGDVVHHYAWSTIPTTANDDPISDLDTNLRGTLRLLQAARARHGVRVLFSSSGGTVYGPASEPIPLPEHHDLQPVTAYGVSKVAAEKYLGFYRALHGLDTRIARLSNPYGIGQNTDRRQGAISVFLRRLAAGQTIEIFGDGSVVRDFLHIDDAVRGLLALADAPPETLPAHVFNIGSGTGLSLNELVGILRRLTGPALVTERQPGRRFDVKWNVLDVALARRHLGWAPRIDVADGIALTLRDQQSGQTDFSSLPSFPPQVSARSIHLRTTGAR